MRTVYIAPLRARRFVLFGRSILSRLPGVALVGVFVYAFLRDPVWPYNIMRHPFVAGAFKLFTNAEYRTSWMSHWMALFVVVVALGVILSVAFKMGVWNKAFKILKVRTREQEDKVETELGRVYWIEDYSGRGALLFGKWLLRVFGRVDLRVGADPRAKHRTVKKEPAFQLALSREGGTDYVLAPKPKFVPRTIFYKATFWPPINPISPHRSMHRLIVAVPDEAIRVHDGTTVMVTGTNPKRDMSEDYPTFYLTAEENEFVALDLKHYKDTMDKDIKQATYTTNIASQMDTFLLKDQRKFQEISVPVNPEMAALVKEAKK